MKKILLLLAFLSVSLGFCQTDNMDFEQGNFNNWTLDIGVRTTPTVVDWNGGSANELNAQIRIMNPSVPPLDEYGLLCAPALNIPTSFPGGVYSARLGDNLGGRRAARISRTFTVTPTESYLQYSYAVILEEPGHSEADQPKFIANIKDSNGDIINCGEFEASAGSNAISQGFVACNYDRAYRCDFPISDCSDANTLGGGEYPVQILPWTSGGADLSPFIGQQITIEFIALDCMLGGHGGTAYVEVNVEPLEIQVEGLCLAGPNDITLTAPLGFTSYLWSTGENTQSINVTGAQFGDMFNVNLTSNTGCDTMASIVLGPVAMATIDDIPDQEICQGGSAIISPTGTDVGDFSFPDLGTTGNSAVVSPTVTTTYTVIARDENGCDGGSTMVTITVLPSTGSPFPNADFELETIITDQANPCNTVQFNNLSDYCKSDLTYLWDFGDGSPTSTEQNPIHTFPNTTLPETYYITLTVTSTGDGLSDIHTVPFTTSTISPSFYLIENCGVVTATNISNICGATFDNYPSFVYSWGFGDGNTPITTDSSQPEFDYTYTTSGLYTVTLTLTDASGIVLTTEQMVNVTVALTADFEFTLDCYDVRFTDLSASCDPIVLYEWDFGDGSIINNEVSPIHTYTTIGPHNVILTINDGTNTEQQTLPVLLAPDTIIPEFDFSIACNTVTFIDLSNSCVPLTYLWNFGDGSSTSTEQNPVHSFAYDENYDVTLTINDGMQDYTISKPILILSEFLFQLPLDLEACSDANNQDAALFDLAEQTNYILSTINAGGIFFPPVTYHLNESDAENNLNSLSLSYTNTANPQNIYTRIEDSNGCFQIFPFSLSVQTTPATIAIDNIDICTLDDATMGYDLNQINARIFQQSNPVNTNTSYHTTEVDAMQRQNAISSINLNAGVTNTIYIRTENNLATDCFSISPFNIRMDNENTDIDDRCMPFFSNTMTPNQDGSNDFFFIQNIESFPLNHLTIYNRWGHLVYETNGYNNNWEGHYNGKPLPVATYYYVMELNDDTQRTHSGYISILR